MGRLKRAWTKKDSLDWKANALLGKELVAFAKRSRRWKTVDATSFSRASPSQCNVSMDSKRCPRSSRTNHARRNHHYELANCPIRPQGSLSYGTHNWSPLFYSTNDFRAFAVADNAFHLLFVVLVCSTDLPAGIR